MSVVYKKLEEVCEILDSQRVPITAKDRKSGVYPYYGANGLQDHVSDYIFDDELVLLAEDGGNFGSKDRPIAYRVSGKCWVNNHAHVLKAKSDIHIDYLCYALMFYNTDGLVNGATRQKLTQAAMRQMVIPYRCMKEQEQIVDEISRVFHLIAVRNEELDLLEQLVKSRFIELFGDPATNPKGWITKPLLDMGYCKNGMNFHTGDSGIEMHCLGVGDFKDLSVIDGTESLPVISLKEAPPEESMLRDGDIVFVRSNGNKALVGRCLVVYPHNTPTTYSGFCIRYRLTSSEVNTAYLLRVLKADSMRKKMTGRGANIQNLNQQILATLDIPLPPTEQQQQFAAFVEQTDKSKFFACQTLSFSLKLANNLQSWREKQYDY